MLNNIVVMGRITKTPELRYTQSGNAVTSFTLACERDFKGENGERETDFIDVVAWRKTAEFVCSNFTKGRAMVASGRLQIREWKDNNGVNRRNSEIIAEAIYFADTKKTEEKTENNFTPIEDEGDIPF